MPTMTRTLIYMHRGANKEAAENTRTAFDRALQYTIDGMETDVQLSRDEVTVLWHDRFLNKVGLPEKHIDDFDYAQLCKMDFAKHFPGSTHAEGILSLQDFLAAYRMRTNLLIEIKNRDWEDMVRQQLKVRQTLQQIGDAGDGRVLISSFNLESLIYAHSIAPDFPLVCNFEPEQGLVDAQFTLAEHPFLHGLCLHISALDETLVAFLRGQRKSVAVYTCNSDEEISCALRLGVDILISDLPQKALHLRGA